MDFDNIFLLDIDKTTNKPKINYGKFKSFMEEFLLYKPWLKQSLREKYNEMFPSNKESVSFVENIHINKTIKEVEQTFLSLGQEEREKAIYFINRCMFTSSYSRYCLLNAGKKEYNLHGVNLKCTSSNQKYPFPTPETFFKNMTNILLKHPEEIENISSFLRFFPIKERDFHNLVAICPEVLNKWSETMESLIKNNKYNELKEFFCKENIEYLKDYVEELKYIPLMICEYSDVKDVEPYFEIEEAVTYLHQNDNLSPSVLAEIQDITPNYWMMKDIPEEITKEFIDSMFDDIEMLEPWEAEPEFVDLAIVDVIKKIPNINADTIKQIFNKSQQLCDKNSPADFGHSCLAPFPSTLEFILKNIDLLPQQDQDEIIYRLLIPEIGSEHKVCEYGYTTEIVKNFFLNRKMFQNGTEKLLAKETLLDICDKIAKNVSDNREKLSIISSSDEMIVKTAFFHSLTPFDTKGLTEQDDTEMQSAVEKLIELENIDVATFLLCLNINYNFADPKYEQHFKKAFGTTESNKGLLNEIFNLQNFLLTSPDISSKSFIERISILEHFIEKECLNKYKEETSLESIYGEKSINVPFVYKLTSNEFKSIKEVLEIYMRENKGAYNSLFEEIKKEIDLSIKCVGDDENVFIDFFNTYHDLTPGNLCVTEKQLSIPKGRISQIKMQNFNEKGFNALENIVKSASASYINKLKNKIYSFINEKLTPVKKDCFLEDAHTVLSYAESITKTSQLMDERVEELSTEVKKDIPNLEKDDELLPF